jgi:hypothetical protein
MPPSCQHRTDHVTGTSEPLLIPEVAGLVTTAERCYSGVTKYPDGGGLTAAEQGRREQVRLSAELIELSRKEMR